MTIIERVAMLLRANINDLLDRAEDPEKVVKQLLLDMQSSLLQVKTQVAAAMADEQRMKKRWDENQTRATEWMRKAELAVGKGDDDLAREALARHNTYKELADGFQRQYERQATQVAALRDALRQLETKLETVEARKELLIARSRQAKAQRAIAETVNGLDYRSPVAQFERLEQRVEEDEARATAITELGQDTLEARFAELDTEDRLNTQLQGLKAAVKAGKEEE